MNLLTPKDLNEVLELRQNHPNYTVLAGGTDVCALMNGGFIKPEGLINIWGIGELAEISEDEDHIYIGALTTHTKIVESDLVQKYIPVLAKACQQIGARQIQNRGTIGGNVMNASPAGDTLPVLLAYDVDVEASSIKSSRWIPFTKFYTGYRKTALKESEIVTRFRIKKPETAEKADFIKLGARKAQAVSKIMACFRLRLEGDKISSFHAAFGSVAAIPVRLSKTEAFLKGKKLTSDIIDKASNIAKSEVKPIDDVRSTGEYRKHVTGVLIGRFLNNIGARYIK